MARTRPAAMLLAWLAILASTVSLSSPPASAAGPLALGINLDVNADWSTSVAWADVRCTFRPWGMPDQPWVENPKLKLTPDGYPLSDAGTLSYLHNYPDGIYRMTYEGAATFTAGGMGRMGRTLRQGNLTTADVIIRHDPKVGLFQLKVTKLDPTDPLRNFHLMIPGAKPGQIYATEFLQRLAPFRVIRFMDWQNTNGTPIKEWVQRTSENSFLQTGPTGVSYENIIALANAAKKDVWINIPDQASDEFVEQLAKLLKSRLDPALNVYVEYSNELWNGQFTQAHRIVEAARDNPALTDNDAYARAAQQIAFKIDAISAIFRKEFGNSAGRVRPVLAGQAANSFWIESGLKYLKARGTEPRQSLYGIAIAPYVNFDQEKLDKTGLTLDQLFAAMNDYLDRDVTSWIARHKQLADQYGVKLLAYEGGQHLIAFNPSTGHEDNERLKIEAQQDPRMGKIYEKLSAAWTSGAGDVFVHYAFISAHSKFGCWGLLENMDQRGSPRWDTLMRLSLPAGDANLDGTVDFADFQILKANYGMFRQTWQTGDFNGDGRVDAADLELLRANLKNLTPEEQAEVDALGKPVAP